MRSEPATRIASLYSRQRCSKYSQSSREIPSSTVGRLIFSTLAVAPAGRGRVDMLALRVDGEECGCERGVGDIRAVFASVETERSSFYLVVQLCLFTYLKSKSFKNRYFTQCV